jgi:anti-anti-sigma factor
MNAFVEQQNDRYLLYLSGEITWQQAAEVRSAILTSFQSEQELVLDLSGVALADISLLQLLCATHRSAMLVGRRFTLSGLSAALKQVAASAGYLREMGCMFDVCNSCIFVNDRIGNAQSPQYSDMGGAR